MLEKEKIINKDIFDVEYMTAQKAAQIKIKFITNKKDFKYATIKILRQKINFEGFTTHEDVKVKYEWLNRFMISNFNSITISSQIIDSSDSEPEISKEDVKEIEKFIEITPSITKKKKSYHFNSYDYESD